MRLKQSSSMWLIGILILPVMASWFYTHVSIKQLKGHYYEGEVVSLLATEERVIVTSINQNQITQIEVLDNGLNDDLSSQPAISWLASMGGICGVKKIARPNPPSKRQLALSIRCKTETVAGTIIRFPTILPVGKFIQVNTELIYLDDEKIPYVNS